MVLARKQGLALEHLGEDAAGTPDVHFDIVLLPREHDLGGAVVARGDVAGHLRILDPGQAEIANLEIAVLVDQDVAGLQIAMDNACRMDIFESSLAGKINQRLKRRGRIQRLLTRIWYKKYWMNCFSSGREVNRRCKSVPSSSVTK